MESQRPLVLHFDINKTIVICDPGKGVGCDAMVESLLSEVCWGTWDQKMKDELACDNPAEVKRRAAATWKMVAGPTTEKQPGLLTYNELLEDVLKMEKKEVQTLKTSFTEPGHPGESVGATCEELRNRLKLPEGVSLPMAASAVGEGRHFLLPSFLTLIQHLQKAGRDFRLVFRTFGVDIGTVVQEFNIFCRGEHPCFPGTPPELSERAVSLPSSSGEWYRDETGLHLCLCVRCGGDLELVQQVHGASQCIEALRKKLFKDEPQTLTMALRDYYPYWRHHDESDDSGKLLLVEPPSADLSAHHHIFFDDNIERDRAHIVDARNAATGEPMPFSETQGVYLIKAEPLEAIRDPDYFIKALAAAEDALAKRINPEGQ